MRVFPVVVLTGPRQSGKSTVVTRSALAEGRLAVSLDDAVARAQALGNPNEFIAHDGPITIDEVQRAPDLILAIKMAVDAMGTRRERGKFLLTGSANLLRMRRIPDSLAGRAGYAELWPMTRRERAGRGEVGAWPLFFAHPAREWPERLAGQHLGPADWRTEVSVGGFPTMALQLEGDAARRAWLGGYVSGVLDLDLRELSDTPDISTFSLFMRAVAARIGQLVNYSDIGRDIQVPHTRVRRYLSLLETAYQVVRVEAYTSNSTKRLIKTPKLYWNDSALGLHLAGGEPTGATFENMVAIELRAWAALEGPITTVNYWRTTEGSEVDFVVEHGRKLLPIEVKTSRSLTSRDLAGLRQFMAEYESRVVGGLVLYDGDRVASVGNRIWAVPWWQVM